MHDCVAIFGQNDEPGGPNVDLPPGSLHEKKMEAEKRAMGMNDYNGDMRKAGRGGGGGGPSGGGIYRPPGSKDPPQVEAASYYDKVAPPRILSLPVCV